MPCSRSKGSWDTRWQAMQVVFYFEHPSLWSLQRSVQARWDSLFFSSKLWQNTTYIQNQVTRHSIPSRNTCPLRKRRPKRTMPWLQRLKSHEFLPERREVDGCHGVDPLMPSFPALAPMWKGRISNGIAFELHRWGSIAGQGDSIMSWGHGIVIYSGW